MKDLRDLVDEVPATLVVALGYVTLAFLTDPFDPTTEQFVRHGAMVAVDVADGEPWRLLTYAFLHGGLLHLMFNLYALLSIGPTLERSIGSLRFAILYVVGAIGAAVFATLWYATISEPYRAPLLPLVGGSGSLFAMLGALVALMARSGRRPVDFLGHAGGRNLLAMIAVNFVLGFMIQFVSNAAHFGGLVTGYCLTWFALTGPRAPERRRWDVAVAVLAVFAGSLLLTLRPVTRWDFLLLQWERTEPGARRDALRAAFGRSFGRARGSRELLATDEDLQDLAQDLARLRREQR